MKFEQPKSSIEKVVGVSEGLERKLLEQRAEVFNNQAFEGLKSKEREKTKEELEMIFIANEVTNELRRDYDLGDFNIPDKNVHVVKKENWDRPNVSAVYRSDLQAIAIQEVKGSNLKFLKHVIHEALHFKSHNQQQLTLSKHPDFISYRVGLEVVSRDGKNDYFTELNEALTEELCATLLGRALSSVKDDPLFAGEIKQTEELARRYAGSMDKKSRKPLFNKDVYYGEIQKSTGLKKIADYITGKNSNMVVISVHTYEEQRRMLHSLIDKLWDKNKDQFESREEIFEVFVKAYMTGNILPMGRLIEDTFGKGSLRKIAELKIDKSTE